MARPYTPGWQRLRKQVLERDGHLCQICRETPATRVDHIIPVALGGTNDEDNLQAACRWCNATKHTWVDTDRLTWTQLQGGMLMLARRIEGQQRRLQDLRDLAEEVRPMMEDDPTCTVAQARKQLEELADLLSDALLRPADNGVTG